ncbi:P-loop containing nucleoside triphosphate hydrolase protein [Lophiotrema nucula]|uniref:P-loop containing nucleoside triphosphate hydrolase protein n=1 Tax=Lophiotrema nucula TaxID=690887 RepID=A0A6A5YSM1_9PLEO|nr:P-loop containing nucleoside triphosphate hydrolase protein [Lophiotrema nucula]
MQDSGGNKPQSVICEVRNVFLHKSKESASLSTDYANIDSGDYLGASGIEIESAVLLDALRSVVKFQTPGEPRPDLLPSHPDNVVSDVNTGVFWYPFVDLYHNIEELLAYKTKDNGPKANHSEERNKECNAHIDVLVDYLKAQSTIGYHKAKSAWEESVPTTAFSSLWLLFKPGTDVYVKEHAMINAYVVDSVSGIAQPGAKGPSSLLVKIWNLDFDGKTLGRVSKAITIPVFDDVREISTLPVYPVQFHKDQEGTEPLRQALIKRGKIFVSVVKKAVLQEYTGPSSYYLTRTFSQARVIVDHTSRPWETDKEHKHIPAVNEDKQLGSNRRIAECPCATCRVTSEGSLRRLPFDDYDNIAIDSPNGLTDHQYSLCYSHVYAYALRDRFWDVVEVGGLKPARMDKDIIKTLVLPPENKRMVQAICETYTDKEERENLFFADNIRGKGEGQIILLHGPPGTGKTLTAESVAEYAGRPLLSITAADLGHEPEDLEKNLLRFFRDANNWDAIVLLDEADVYLERRHVSELRRNSIVSIFLRALDYFQGILFLTTNRVGSFDEAFMSRIHIQIGYESLDDSSRQQIWMNSFKKLDSNHKHNGRKIEYSYRAKEFVKISPELQKLEWNGREIRNAFQTAVALACYDAKVNKEEVPVVTEDHFDQVVKMSTNFKEYMKSTLTTDDAGYAFAARLRDDTFISNDKRK